MANMKIEAAVAEEIVREIFLRDGPTTRLSGLEITEQMDYEYQDIRRALKFLEQQRFVFYYADYSEGGHHPVFELRKEFHTAAGREQLFSKLKEFK